MIATRTRFAGGLLSCALIATSAPAGAARHELVGGSFEGRSLLPTGVTIDPTAASGSTFFRLRTGLRADGNADATDATATALSPDGKTLLILTSGYNTNFNTENGVSIVHNVPDPLTGVPDSAGATSNSEWAFVYDVADSLPRQLQKFSIPNTYDGLVWAPDGKRFYVSGGIDDRVLAFAQVALPGSDAIAFAPSYPAIVLGHNENDTAARPTYNGGILRGTAAGSAFGGRLRTGAVVADIALSGDGRTLAAVNMENDSLTIADAATRRVVKEVAFTTPGSNLGRGEFPYGVAVKSDAAGRARTIYVSSLRDDQVLAVDAGGGKVTHTIAVGSAPNNMVLSADASRLYVADGNSDDVAIVDTDHNRLAGKILLRGAGERFAGANPNGLALSPNGKRLYVTLGGENALGVIDLVTQRLIGRIPTGWYPTGVAVSRDGARLFVVNEKSVAGPNPANGYTTPAGLASNTTHKNEYGWALEKAGLGVIPTPADGALAGLSQIVDANNGVGNRGSRSLVYLHGPIAHVIYIVKENRTYDQVFGDLPGTNGDARLTLFPQPITPNHHALAAGFVALDNFYDPGESSGVGWNWTTQGQTNDYVERSQAVLYGNSSFNGLTYDYQGIVRNINLALPQTGAPTPFTVRETGLADPSGRSSILPGPRDPSAGDGDGVLDPDAVGGYLWDEAIRRHLSVRHYGQFVDQNYYSPGVPGYIPITRTPYAAHVPQAQAAKVDLLERTDRYFRGFDQNAPDVFRVAEWSREFDAFVKDRNLPSLELVTINHDHFGSFGTAIEGLNTPTLQMADDDYALGEMVAKVSHSPYWNSTAIFVIEDDSQSGPDHVDSHRSIALVASPYARHGAVIHTTYTTDNLLKSIEQILGLRPLGKYDENAEPMEDVFARVPIAAPYAAIVPGVLCAPPVAKELLGDACGSPLVRKTRRLSDLHDGAWWAAMTGGMDFSYPDHVDPVAFNAILWYGMTGTVAPDNAVL